MSDNEDKTTEPLATAAPETSHKRKIAMLALSGGFLLIALIWLTYWLFWGRYNLYTDDAYVQGNIVQVMPQIPGTVVEINAEETQWVNEGQVIIRLDPDTYTIALEQARAKLAETVRQVLQYYEMAAEAKQKVILVKARLAEAESNVLRRTGLSGNRAVSREEMQHYKTMLDTARANYRLALHQLEASQALVKDTQLYTHPAVEEAKTRFKNAWLNLQRTTIRAPASGYVAKRRVQPGQQVGTASLMLDIIPLNDTWVDANYKESSLENIRINQPVTIYADAYPSAVYHGRVVGLNAGTGSAFALLPPQNATGNWIKIVQRLPVRISLDPEELKKNPLQLGLSLRVTISTRNLDGERMSATSGQNTSIQTRIYQQQLARVNELISKILRENAKDTVFRDTAS